ncbi:hypothetical protein C2S52_020188 [Perilla frutescens var. hirtella]|uniref:WIYLD domain-containing protein n=1 Tax=Perilla frutescens var. hirtella TaxID=608512 RepID=A0AAD4J532_PERFH|nr:hypothetical protein C2S52_020188 [Perilla frutescens var. hirtella]KAH6805617.1 hypothetical protein C2S51_030448 [Perilla frutescens var. frutescens]KAH6827342.1 hypothetical protein C2S53_015950 [Perilla frutescens var. hirtella]
MDAAVDAMLPMGFPEEKVKKHVKELLKEYGGDVAWPFIEDTTYKVLLDSLLAESNDEEQVVQNGNLLEEKSEAGPPDMVESSGAAATDSSDPLLPPANRRTRLPCYGWIDSDEDVADADADDDYDFINLEPSSAAIGGRATLDVSKWTKKRRSRWDVQPGDP